MEIDPVIACGILGNISQLWLKKQFTDLQINIDEETFYCHRFILCACSELFEVLLQSEVKGDIGHPVRDVAVKGLSAETFRLILKAIYKGEDGLNTANMMAFWHAAHKLQIPVLISKCETFVSSHITRENCLEIYTSALLLETDKVIKMVHQFIAENFEYFRKCKLFWLLSSKTMYEILSSRNLKVTTENILVESILKWYCHEPCENNAETVGAGVAVETPCAGDSVEVQGRDDGSGQKLDHSAGVINDKKGGVEIILQPSPATDMESCLQTVAQLHTETSGARKESLRKLLRLVRLNKASRDCLEMLADMDIIMGVKETRDMVKQALETHGQEHESRRKKVVIVNAAISLKKEQVVVFRQKDQVYAYSVDKNKIFHFMSECFCELLSIFSVDKSIFITERGSTETTMTAATFPFSFSDFAKVASVGSWSVIVDDFCYTFKDSGLYRKRCCDESCDWFQLAWLQKEADFHLVNIWKGNIIFYCVDDSGTQVYCFNIEARRFWSILKSHCKHDIISFIHNEQLYILTSEGYIWNMTKHIDSHRTEPQNADITDTCEEEKLWESDYNLLGAVVYTDSLLVFADLNCVTPSFEYSDTLSGVSEIRFIHLNTDTKCYPLVVPTSMLVREV